LKNLDDIAIQILKKIDEIKKENKKPRYLAINKSVYNEFMREFKSSLAYSELDASFLSKVEELEKEIGRFDLKISVGMFYGLHIIISDLVSDSSFIIL